MKKVSNMQSSIKAIKKTRNIIGIDIADHTLSLVELQKNRSQARIVSGARVSIPPGIVVRGRIRDAEKFQELFEYAMQRARPTPITSRMGIMGIADSQLYTHIARLQEKKDSDLENSARAEALNTFPIEKRELVYAYRTLSRTDEGVDTIFIAASRDVLHEWDVFFRQIGITVPFYDSEVLATARGLAAHGEEQPFCLADIGAATTTVSVFDAGGIRYVHSIDHAGSALTDAIAKIESLPFDEAQKRKHELDLADIPTSLATVLPAFFDPVLAEIGMAIKFASNAYAITVNKIILVGGTSMLAGLPEYIEKKIGVDTVRGVPIIGIAQQDRVRFDEPSIESIGLALHGLNAKEYQNAPKLESVPEDISYKEEPTHTTATQAYDANNEQMHEFRDIRKEQRRMRNQILTLIVVLSVGALLIAAAFWYQSQEQARKEVALRKTIPSYTHQQTAEMEISISIDHDVDGMASGRLYQSLVPTDVAVNAAAEADAQVNVRRGLNAGEDYWNVPFDPPFTFLVFDKNEVHSIVERIISERAANVVPFDLGYIAYRAARKSDNPSVFILSVNASITSEAPISDLK